MAVEKDSIGGGVGRSSWRRTITKGFAVLAKVYVYRSRVVCSSLLHLRSSWKVNSPRVGFRFTEFFDVHLWVADRWSVIRVMSSSCSQLCPVKEDSSSIRKPTSDLSSPWSARSARRRGKPNIS